MGTITKTVGTTGRQYSTFQTAFASCPSNFVTDGNSYVLSGYNDSEFTSSGVVLDTSGITTNTTHTLTIQAASGQSWSDNASVQTNAVKYNASNGVALRTTGSYNSCVIAGSLNVSWIGLQFQAASNTYVFDNDISGSATTDQFVTSCIIYQGSGTFGTATPLRYRCGLMTNSWVIKRISGSGSGIQCDYASSNLRFANVIVVRHSDATAAGNAFNSSSNVTNIENCMAFGFTAFANDNTKFSGSNNCSDVAIGFGTSNQASKTYANQFVSSLAASADFKIKTGSDAVNNGATDTTDIPTAVDAVGTSRPQGTAWCIGAWELKSAGTNVSLTGVFGTGSVGAFSQQISTSASLSGVSASGSAGSFTPKVSTDISGVFAAGSVQALTPDPSANITGVAGTGSVGTFTSSQGIGLSGISAAGSVGSFAPSVFYTLTGVTAIGSVQAFTPKISTNLAGVSATGSVGSLPTSISAILSGVAATGSPGVFSVQAGGNANVNLIGVSAIGAIGSFAPSIGLNTSLNGISGSGQVGNLTLGIVVPMSSISASGQAGLFNFHNDVNINLIGISAIGFAGSFAVQLPSTLKQNLDHTYYGLPRIVTYRGMPRIVRYPS